MTWGDYQFAIWMLVVGAAAVVGVIVFHSRIRFQVFLCVLIWGGVGLLLGGLEAWNVFHGQPLSPNHVEEALVGSPCVAMAMRAQLAEADEPMTRRGLSAIENDCEHRAEKKAELEAVQAVLEQQRQAARQPEAEIGKE
ncbi:hypothetical protein [Salinicola peritrichatus]|uniref:hypothetical protein n=1 Tax=Salinicola peritrichatus TaxID=1267424 RepID=UPI000DA21EB6|nr:hypothetical protein [Salinicola peritrichatus]